MSELEFVGKMNPSPFISLREEEKMRIEEIKKRLKNEQVTKEGKLSVEPECDLTYERDVQEETQTT